MAKFVLIIIVFSRPLSGITTAEFDSAAACQAALSALVERTRDASRSFCVPKST